MEEKGKDAFLVKDELRVPSENKNKLFTFFLCKLNGEEKEGLFGLINKWDNSDFEDINVKEAWIINPEKKKIEPVPSGSVVCSPNAEETIIR